MSSEITAIVPIKSNSKRLPNKNFLDFNGRPLYHWILKTLESVDEIDRIIVNTDAEEILNHGEEYFDIEVSKRPERFIGDPTTRDIIEYEVSRVNSDTYVQTYCTNPLVKSESFSEAISKFIEADECDSLFTATRHQKRLYDENLQPINHNPTERMRSQDLPPVYEDNSNIYIYQKGLYEKDDHEVGAVPIGENPIAYEMNEIEAIDIDVRSEFEMAEYFHRKQINSGNQSPQNEV